MTWNPSVRQAPIIVTAKKSPVPEVMKQKEMEGAAIAVIAMLMARKNKLRSARDNGQPPRPMSAWIVQGRMDMANRWFG